MWSGSVPTRGGLALLGTFLLACGGGGGSSTSTPATSAPAPASLSLAPSSVSVQLSTTQSFTANNPNVTWQVNGVVGGSASLGTISSTGLYTAPATLPSPASVTITAILTADTSRSASALVTLIAPPTGTTYYVSTTGSDSNAGTLGAPWKTIQHAANTVAAGSTVNVRGGIYNEMVRFGVSGSAGDGFITFQSQPGEVAILDGASPTALHAAGGDAGLIHIEGQSYLIIRGFEIRNFTTNSTSESPAGIYISGSGSHIQVLSNHVHHITTTAPDTPSKMASNAFGIAVKGTGRTQALTQIVIDGNELDHLKTGASESLTVNGNVDGFSVTNNQIHDNNNIGIDCIGHEGVNGAPAGNTDPNDAARNGVVSGNTVYNISSYGNPAYGNAYAADGIYVDGGTNIVIEGNTIHDADINLEVASEWPGNVSSYITVRNNLIYNGLACGISIGGYDSGRGGTDHCDIVNNTLFHNDTKNQGGGEFQIQYHATNNRFENNILYANPSALFITTSTGSVSGVTIDYNLCYATTSATPMGAHSKWGDPQFLNTSTPDFRVQGTSPAIGAGLNLGASVQGTFDFAGHPRLVGTLDVGAYEQ